MPKLACKLTKKSKYHISNWRQPVTVDEKECEVIREALEEKIGREEEISKTPKVCQT